MDRLSLRLTGLNQVSVYLNLVTNYVGRRVYLVFLMSTLGAIAEGVGLTILFPILLNVVIRDGSNNLIELNGFESIPFLNILFSLSPIHLAILLVGVYLIKSLLIFSAQAFAAHIRSLLLATLKRQTFAYITKIKYENYSQLDAGELANLASEQVTKSIVAYNALIQLGVSLFQCCIYLSIAMVTAWQLGLVLVFLGAALILVFRRINIYVRSLSRNGARENGVLLDTYLELVSGFKYFKATGKIPFLVKKSEVSIKKLAFYEKLTVVWASFTQALQEPIGITVILFILAFHGEIFGLQIEFLAASLALFYRAYQSLFGVQTYSQHLMSNVGSLEAINNMGSRLVRLSETLNNPLYPVTNGDIQFSKVGFKYRSSEDAIFENLNLKIDQGSFVVIKGESGSGKTTFVDLVCGLLTPTEGCVKLGGKDISGFDPLEYANNIGYVGQDNALMNDSVINNLILTGLERSPNNMETVWSYLERLGLKTAIQRLPDKLDTVVGEKGDLFSGGQRQRILIARELLKKPSILILDEATSGLDALTDLKTTKLIRSAVPGTTIIYITHKDVAHESFDAVFFLENSIIKKVP